MYLKIEQYTVQPRLSGLVGTEKNCSDNRGCAIMAFSESQFNRIENLTMG